MAVTVGVVILTVYIISIVSVVIVKSAPTAPMNCKSEAPEVDYSQIQLADNSCPSITELVTLQNGMKINRIKCSPNAKCNCKKAGYKCITATQQIDFELPEGGLYRETLSIGCFCGRDDGNMNHETTAPLSN